MKCCMVEITKKIAWETEKRFAKSREFNFFSVEFQKKSNFSLNSGNFYVTLQPELCADGFCDV